MVKDDTILILAAAAAGIYYLGPGLKDTAEGLGTAVQGTGAAVSEITGGIAAPFSYWDKYWADKEANIGQEPGRDFLDAVSLTLPPIFAPAQNVASYVYERLRKKQTKDPGITYSPTTIPYSQAKTAIIQSEVLAQQVPGYQTGSAALITQKLFGGNVAIGQISETEPTSVLIIKEQKKIADEIKKDVRALNYSTTPTPDLVIKKKPPVSLPGVESTSSYVENKYMDW